MKKSLPAPIAQLALPIVHIGDPLLWRRARAVKDRGDLAQLTERMFLTLQHAAGVGLAGPQIGKSLRFFVMDIHPTKRRKKLPDLGRLTVINPRILATSDEIVTDWEGCLSITTSAGLIFGPVPRPQSIEVEYIDASDTKHKRELDGFAARVFQHEMDHLDGVLFLQRMQDLSRLVDEPTYIKMIEKRPLSS